MRATHAAAFTFAAILICQPGALDAQTGQGKPSPPKPQGSEIAGPRPATVTLATREKPATGRYLTTARGHALYIYTGDERGKGESKCLGPCLEAWPPAYTEGDPQTASEDLDPKRLGVMKRGGRRQVTYHGWPLYYYRLDAETAATSGQGVYSYDGNWYLLAPNGDPIKAPREGEARVPR